MDDVKVGKVILLDGIPYEVLTYEHLKVAQGKGLQKTTIKNLLTGNVVPRTFREVDQIETAEVVYFTAEYLYGDESNFYFMNIESYEQVFIPKEAVGDSKYFLAEGDKVIVLEFLGRPINVKLNAAVTLEVEETPPGEKGDTATGGRKPATLTTGLTVKVPLFIKVGDKIRVDTRTYEYLNRE